MIQRLLIVLAVAALAYLLFQNVGSEENNSLSQEELQKLLKETVTREWEAKVAADWLTVYEILDPKQKPNLTSFMQGRDKFYFKNWELLEMNIEGEFAKVQVKHDWGVILDIELDLGTPEKKGAVKNETYRFDSVDKKWYQMIPQQGEQTPKSTPQKDGIPQNILPQK